jgi:hypothetical protein
MQIQSFTKKAVAVAVLTGAAAGANAGIQDLGAISIGTPTTFFAQFEPTTGLLTETLLFTLPKNGGSGYDLLDIPLSFGPAGNLQTVFTGMFLTYAGADGMIGGGDDLFIKSSVTPSTSHLTMQVSPLDTTFSTLAAGGHFYLDVVARGTGTLGGLVAGSVSVTAPPIPEPESYAMFLAGLGIMGAIIRRRSRR